LIERRFESLTPPARHVLSAAAAISRDFDFALLRRACGLAEEDVVTGLEELVRRRLLHAAGEGFEFTHDRLRDVAYAQLIQPRRTLLHRRLADALVELRATDLTDHHAVIAAHYAEAGAWADAARHLYEAAQTAHDRLAYPEAVGLLGRALDALTRVRRDRPAILLEIDIRLRLFRCLNPLADARAAEHVILARTLIAEAPDDSREAIILVELAELQRFARDLDAALDAAERARTLASSSASRTSPVARTARPSRTSRRRSSACGPRRFASRSAIRTYRRCAGSAGRTRTSVTSTKLDVMRTRRCA
jgi:predicted ATPase